MFLTSSFVYKPFSLAHQTPLSFKLSNRYKYPFILGPYPSVLLSVYFIKSTFSLCFIKVEPALVPAKYLLAIYPSVA